MRTMYYSVSDKNKKKKHVFVPGHSLYWKVNNFLITNLEVNSELRRLNNAH